MALRILVAALCCSCSFLYSQTSNFVSASQSNQGTSIKADWTIGELIVEGYSNSTLNVTHGIVETSVMFVITGDIPVKESISKVYPTPFQSEFFIETSAEDIKDYAIGLIDASGKAIAPSIEYTSPNKARINAIDFTSGLYILTLKTNTSIKTFKLVKQ